MEQDNLKSESANDPKKGGVLGQLPPAARFRLMGEVLNLLMASTRYRKYRLQDIVVQFFPAIDLNQFMLFRTKNGPIGLVTWAFLTDEALAGYVERKEFPKIEEWTLGSNLVLMDFVAPFGHSMKIENELKSKVFPDKEMKILSIDLKKKQRTLYTIKGDNLSKPSTEKS